MLATAAMALTSCGGSSDPGPAPSERAGLGAGPSLGTLTCSDWKRADPATRRRTIERLRAFAGGQVSGEGVRGRGAVLDDDKAHRLFDSRCRDSFARAFLLYKLYTHAAGFAGTAP